MIFDIRKLVSGYRIRVTHKERPHKLAKIDPLSLSCPLLSAMVITTLPPLRTSATIVRMEDLLEKLG